MSLSLLWAGTPVDVDDTVVTTQLPEQFSDQVKEVAARLMQLCDAETMEQHQMAVANLSQVGTSLYTPHQTSYLTAQPPSSHRM